MELEMCKPSMHKKAYVHIKNARHVSREPHDCSDYFSKSLPQRDNSYGCKRLLVLYHALGPIGPTGSRGLTLPSSSTSSPSSSSSSSSSPPSSSAKVSQGTSKMRMTGLMGSLINKYLPSSQAMTMLMMERRMPNTLLRCMPICSANLSVM